MCTFPSKALILERRKMAAEADKTHDMDRIRLAMQFAMDTDNLRFAHETLTGCDCWIRSYRELDHA